MAEAARRAPARKRTRRDVEDDLPLFSGRLVIAAVFIVLMVVFPMSKLGDWIEPRKTTTENTDLSKWVVGGSGRVQITLITADYNLLTCASQLAVAGKHCAYKSETELWPRDPNAPIDDNKKDIIQPYRTWPDNKLILVAGLWADPAVALRLQREPPAGVPQKKLSRFIADCEMRFIGQLSSPRLRWPSTPQWLNEGDSIVAQPVSCKIQTQE
jgi:hypothetical protein